MRKIFTEANIKKIYSESLEEGICTIQELISFHASQFVSELRVCYEDYLSRPFIIFSGPSYNGAIGLNIALILSEQIRAGHQIEIFLFKPPLGLSKEATLLKEQLLTIPNILLHEIDNQFTPPQIEHRHIIIDALFGTDLPSPLKPDSGFGKLIKYINQSEGPDIVSVDIPSGLSSDSNQDLHPGCAIQATHTFCLDFPKLSSFFGENREFYGELRILDFKLSERVEKQLDTRYFETTDHDVVLSLKRNKLSPALPATKGEALLIGGGSESIGSLILSTRGCLHTGVSHVAIQTTEEEKYWLQMAIPEVKVIDSLPLEYKDSSPQVTTKKDSIHSKISALHSYTAIGLGGGLDRNPTVKQYLENLFFSLSDKQFVFDEEAIGIFTEDDDLLDMLPEKSILILSGSAFDRLFKVISTTEEQRVEQASAFAKRKMVYIILQGYRTAICMPDGKVIFNTSGTNEKEVQGGHYVLLGIVLSLLAQNYSPFTASIIAPHLYGLACNLYIGKYAHFSLTASDIIKTLPEVFRQFK